MIYNRSSQQSA